MSRNMVHNKKRQLKQEYFETLYKLFLPLHYAGFSRFTMQNGQIKDRTIGSLIYNICVLIVSDIGAGYLMYVAVYMKKYFSLPETLSIIHFTAFANLMIIDITFGDKRSGSRLIENCIEIDTFLGTEETKFMRHVALNAYKFLYGLVAITQITVVTYMYFTFNVSMTIHVVGSLYFSWLFFSYDDYCFFLYHCTFLSLRTRYLNVALMKLTRMNREYIPKQLIFNTLFWKDEYDERVTFRGTASAGEFIYAFKMLFEQWRRTERCYRFLCMLGVLTVVMGTFIAVQSYAMYLETPDMFLRAGALSGWAIATWVYLLIMGLQTDMFYRQIEQTKLICACTQLKPSNSSELFKLTENILRTLETREARFCLYDKFFCTTGVALKLGASTFVYITAQLQMAFPSSHDQTYDNSTMDIGSDDLNVFRRFLV